MNDLIVKGKVINIFCVNTPFQLFIVRLIISQYLKNETNIIFSTIRSKDNDGDTIHINKSLVGLWNLRRYLSFIKNNIEKCSFFIPHLNSLLASIFYDFSVKYARPINVFYEGVALYYDPIVEIPYYKRIMRKMQALLLGYRYQYYEQLFPRAFIDRVNNCYAPKDILLEKYKMVYTFTFPQNKVSEDGAVLVLLSNKIAGSTIFELSQILVNVLKNSPINKVYIKPHYELEYRDIERVRIFLNGKLKNNLEILDKKTPIELLYTELAFSVVVSQAFSSALINMKLIFQQQPKIYIIEKDKEMYQIAKRFCLDYE